MGLVEPSPGKFEMPVDGDVEWQSHAQLASVLELVFWWLDGAELARAASACGAWREAAGGARAWRRLLGERAPGAGAASRALAALHEGACPWRELYVAAVAPWRPVARLVPTPAPSDTPLAPSDTPLAPSDTPLAPSDTPLAPSDTPLAPSEARLSAAALNRAGDTLALVANDCSYTDDCSFTVWKCYGGRWAQESAGSVAAMGWRVVTSAEWAPRGTSLLLGGPVPLAASRGALAVLQPAPGGGWRVVSRAGGSGGCWAGAAFLSLELARLSAPHHAPHYATDVWLNAATQEAESEFAGVAARVLRVYNEEPALITLAACAETPLDERAAREWAEAEASARAEDEQGAVHMKVDGPVEEIVPNEDYYRATYEGCVEKPRGAWIQLVVLACGGVLGAWLLPRAAPPPLRVHAPLAERVAARRAKRALEAAAEAAGVVEVEEAAPSAGELRARCDAPAARLRLPARVLGLHVHDSGRCVWASVSGGAVCASLPALLVLRSVPLAPPSPAASPHYIQPHSYQEYFGSPCGAWSGAGRVWGAAPGAGALLPPSAPRRRQQALLLTEDALHVWECRAPRAPAPPISPTPGESTEEEKNL